MEIVTCTVGVPYGGLSFLGKMFMQLYCNKTPAAAGTLFGSKRGRKD